MSYINTRRRMMRGMGDASTFNLDNEETVDIPTDFEKEGTVAPTPVPASSSSFLDSLLSAGKSVLNFAGGTATAVQPMAVRPVAPPTTSPYLIAGAVGLLAVGLIVLTSKD